MLSLVLRCLLLMTCTLAGASADTGATGSQPLSVNVSGLHSGKQSSINLAGAVRASPAADAMLRPATHEEALRLFLAGYFVPVADAQFGSIPDGRWLALSLSVDTPSAPAATSGSSPVILHIDNYLIDSLDVAIFSGIAQTYRFQIGAMHGAAAFHLGYTSYDIPLVLEPGRHEIVILARSPEAFIPISLYSFNGYLHSIARRELVFAGLYGTILAVILASIVLILARTENRRAILYHTGFQLLYVAYQLSRDGILGSLFWPANAFMVHRAYLFMTAWSLVFLQLLMINFLELRVRLPRAAFWLKMLILVPLLFSAGLVVVPAALLPFYQRLGRLLLIAVLLVQLVASAMTLASRDPSKRVFGAGLHLAIWGILLGALKAIGILSYGYFQYFALAGVMLESIFFMVSVFLRIDNLAMERTRLQAGLREAHMSLLQSRGRPHFLSNTFSMVRSLLHTDPVKADEAFGLLIRDFRFFTDNVAAPLIPLRDEIAFVDNYLGLMCLRHGDHLIVERSCATVPDSCMIPPLTLQPLIENCFKHGQPATDGTIRIQLELVQSGKNLHFSARNHVGLPAVPAFPQGKTHRNILSRLRYYHPEANLMLSIHDGEFIATLSWPMEPAP